MTTELKTEMRAHVVGPCDEAQKAELRELLKQKGEKMEAMKEWKIKACINVCTVDSFDWSADVVSVWVAVSDQTPTISFPDFKAKYLTK